MRRRRTADLSSNRRSTSIVTRRTDASCHRAGWQASILAAQQTEGSLVQSGRRVMRQRGPSIGDGRWSNTVPPTRRSGAVLPLCSPCGAHEIGDGLSPLSVQRRPAHRQPRHRRADASLTGLPSGSMTSAQFALELLRARWGQSLSLNGSAVFEHEVLRRIGPEGRSELDVVDIGGRHDMGPP